MAKEYRIAVIPGDGIGKEVVPEGCRVLKTVEQVVGDFDLYLEEYPWGSEYYLKYGRDDARGCPQDSGGLRHTR